MKLSQYFSYKSDAKEEREARIKGKVFKTLYKNVRIPWFSIILGAFLAVFNSLVILTQYSNYLAIFSGALTSLSPLWQYLLASIIQYLMIFACVIANYAYVTIVTGVRKKMWRKMVRLPLKSYEDEPAGGMLSRITSDAEYASKPFAAAITVLQIIVYILSLSAAAPKDIPQALGFLVVFLILAVVTMVVSVKISSKATTFLQSKISSMTAYYTEHLAAIKFIKSSNAEEKAINESYALIEERYKAALYNAFATGLQTLSNNFTYIIIYACAFLGGILAIKAGTITTATPINTLYVFGMSLELTLVALMSIPTYFAATEGGSKKLVSIFAEQEEDTTTGKDAEKPQGDITFEKVSFAYSDRNVLNDVSVKIPQGKVTAIVGPNGSGKSTMARVLERLYASDSGEISFGEKSAEEVSLASWRSQFALVPQKPALFSGTIKENIVYGAGREVSEEEVLKAVHLANLDEVVAAHAEGLNYKIGVHGLGLSGGEQQRLAIARAMVRNSSLLILDEATANLDSKTEQEVKQAISALMKGRTVVEIAHSASGVKDADNVIVLDHGKVAAFGTPEEVKKNNSFFNRLMAQ